MTNLQRAQLALEMKRRELSQLLDVETRGEDFSDKLAVAKAAIDAAQLEVQAAGLVEPDVTETRTETLTDTEGDEYRELRSKVNFGRYIQGALTGGGITHGPELELNQHLGIAENLFPLELLAGPMETRAKRDGDAEASQGTWLDRVMHGTAADRVGISFRSVSPGVAAFPVTTAGGGPVQRGRSEAVSESTYTVAVTEIKPARRAVHGIYSIEDNARLPGLADAIQRDMGAAMSETVDRVCFNGDLGANEGGADIVGMKTAAVSEATLTQANKVKADELVKFFLAYVDGQYAASLADVRIVSSVGSNQLWGGQVHAATVSNQTVASFLRENGINWTVRGGIETNTANGDFGAYIGLGRGIDGAGIAAVWEAAELIRDPYSGAAKGEVQLTLNYLWQLAFPRTSNFKRLKYVS